jgi:hypothetical protein
VYRLADVEKNHEAYAKQYRIAASSGLQRLAASTAGRVSVEQARGRS